MQLVMYLGNDFIASVTLNEELVSKPGYIGMLKRRLREEHSAELQESPHKPEFLVVNMSAAGQASQRSDQG